MSFVFRLDKIQTKYQFGNHEGKTKNTYHEGAESNLEEKWLLVPCEILQEMNEKKEITQVGTKKEGRNPNKIKHLQIISHQSCLIMV